MLAWTEKELEEPLGDMVEKKNEEDEVQNKKKN